MVHDFEDYTTLYRDSWLDDDALRWLLSTVPTAMMFDDHELIDNWNLSAAWLEEQRSREGWRERLDGALISYWVYQHLGNLAPDVLRADELFAAVRADADGADRLGDALRELDRDREGSRWAFRRDLGPIRMVVLDTRATRVLEEGRRDMLDTAEWAWLDSHLDDAQHLVIASSVPVVYAQGFHELQVWSERVTSGAWGPLASRAVERLRRRLSLSGWPSFPASLSHLSDLIRDVAEGRRGDLPSSVVLISGDVHHGYVGELSWPDDRPERAPVHQVVTSPFRNPLLPHERLAQRFAATRFAARLFGRLARRVGASPAPFTWRRLAGPDFANQISTLEADGERLSLTQEGATHGRNGRSRLRTLWTRRLDRGSD